MRVLVVDDHADVRRALRRLLTLKTTFEVVGEAGDGLEAIELVSSLQPDVVIMDINMPGIDGIEATRRIKSIAPKVHVLAFTGSDEVPVISDMLAAGASGYVLKSDTSEGLVYALQAAAKDRFAIKTYGEVESPL